MNLDTLNEVKDRTLKNDLTNEVEIDKMNEEMNDLSEKLQDYLKDNKEPNRTDRSFNIPVDFELNTAKNEFGDTTILGKITIEKSAIRDLEKIQDKAENVKDKVISSAKNGLEKVYGIVKNTIIEKAAKKVLNVGAKALNIGSKLLKTAVKALGTVGKKVLKI